MPLSRTDQRYDVDNEHVSHGGQLVHGLVAVARQPVPNGQAPHTGALRQVGLGHAPLVEKERGCGR